jgi:hypothetical protein
MGRPVFRGSTEVMMDTEALQRLRFDTRLRGRRGWTEEEEYEEEIARLPDVSEKIKSSEPDARSHAEPSSGSAVPDTHEV